MKKILIKLLLKWYIGRNREIKKLIPEQEFFAYLLKDPQEIREMLKSVLTGYTVLYFEAESEEERLVIKGSALAIKALLLQHQTARAIMKESKDNQECINKWIKNKLVIN